MNSTFTFLNSFANISEDIYSDLQKISTFKKLDAGIQIVKLNEIPTKVYLLVSGTIRCYLSTEDGKEFNKSFYLPTSIVGSLTALICKKPSQFTFETLSECKIYEIDYNEFVKLSKKNIAVSNLYSRLLEFIYIKYEKRLVELISLNAKDRYLELQRQIPEVDALIPQYHIASYLGITPVQLSRIRKKIGVY